MINDPCLLHCQSYKFPKCAVYLSCLKATSATRKHNGYVRQFVTQNILKQRSGSVFSILLLTQKRKRRTMAYK